MIFQYNIFVWESVSNSLTQSFVTLFILFQIFTVVKTGEFLDSIYVPKKNPEMREIMGRVVEDVNSCMEAGVL